LFRIPTIGGKPEKLLENIASPVSFSSDGQEMVFLRKDLSSVMKILVADKDGHNERVLLQGEDQRDISYPALGPDGRSVAFWKTDTATPRSGQIFLLDNMTGLVKPFSDEKWDAYYKIEWMPDGSGVVTVGSRLNDDTSTHRDEIYFVSYPEGRSRRITDDGYRHDVESLGVTKDGAVLTVPDKLESQIWSMNADGDPATATQITRGTVDGKAGLVSLPDRRIAYLTRVAGDMTIWVANDDGSNAKQLATGLHFVEELRADPSGRFLVFSTRENSGHHLFRINTDGSDMRQLTFGERSEIDSTISPDGEAIVTDNVRFGDDDPSQKLLEKFPSQGGEPEILPVKDCENPIYSPDGAMLSCVRENAEALVLSAADGHEIESYDLPPSSRVNIGVGWTPDSSGLIVMRREKYEQDKMLIIPRNGKPPYDFTTFPGDIIHRYAFSRDGKRLFVSRGYPMADAVLIKSFL
jgi:Tol biopolymer transport system component